MRTSRHFPLILSLLAASACRSSDGGGEADAGSNGGGDADLISSVTIYQVQSDEMPVGTSVNLRDVVVSAVDRFGARSGGIYVQEKEGGAYSGVFVYVSESASAGLSVGDRIDLVGGVKDEFALQSDESGRKLTEIVPSEGGSISITKIGEGAPPEPEILNPWDLAASDEEAEKWEGVLVQFDNVSVLSRPYGVSSSDETLKEMEVTGPFRVGGSLTDLGDSIQRDDCFTSIRGIGDYFFNYKVLPRSAADMVGDGSECPAPEAADNMCSDSLDNDYDGFSDCADFSCQEEVEACTVETSIVAAQSGVVADNSKVRFTDVLVTAIHGDGKRFWVQDAGGAAAYNGVHIFRPSNSEALPSSVALGSTVTLTGNLSEYFGEVTNITNVEIEASAAGSADDLEILSGVSLSALATDQQYEGVLVQLEDVAIVDPSDASCSDQCSFSVGTASEKLWIYDEIFRFEAVAGDCLESLTGVMHYDTYNDRAVLLPRSGDVAGGGDCS